MESWLEYLAFLNWQHQQVSIKDFKRVFKIQKEIHSVHQLSQYISCKETQLYLKNSRGWWKTIEKHKEYCVKQQIQVTWPFHPKYPIALFKMESPPPIISWKGEPCWKDHFLFSVVGSRHAYEDTCNWMDMHLSSFFKRRTQKFCVMSGGARGVDQKAHALSLATEKPTLCFLPSGIKYYYPSELKKWEKSILDGGGAFISVFPLSTEIRKFNFHIRNKVLASMSDLLFIAQAQARSGTMVTARYALHAGVNVSVLPGSPLYTGYRGSLSLINDGCFMVRDHLDLETLYHSSLYQSSLYQEGLPQFDLQSNKSPLAESY